MRLSASSCEMVSTAAVVAGHSAGFRSGGATGLQFLAGAEAMVGVASLDQLRGSLGVEIKPLGLIERALIPIHPEPAQALEDPSDHVGGGALEVRVFDAKDESSSGMAGKEPAEQGGASSSHMQKAGRGRRKADAYCLRRGFHGMRPNSYPRAFLRSVAKVGRGCRRDCHEEQKPRHEPGLGANVEG